MELLNAAELGRAARRHPQSANWLAVWRVVVEAAEWRGIADVRATYPSADGVSLGRGRGRLVVTVFNVGGNDDRLLTRIHYQRQLVQVEALLTHAEYSKNKWKDRYA